MIADKDLTLKNWKFGFPSTADRNRVEMLVNKRFDVFAGDEGMIKTSSTADWKFSTEIFAAGDSRLNKGVIRAIPLHQTLTAETIHLKARNPQKWRFEVEVISIQ